MTIFYSECILLLASSFTLAATTTTSATTTTTAWIDQGYPKALISLGVLAACVLIGFGIAKLADYCYEREALRDDASDISENTKELLKAQLAVMGFRRPKKTDGKMDKEKQRGIFRTWAEKVREKKKKRNESETGRKSPTKSAQSSGKSSPSKSHRSASKSPTPSSKSNNSKKSSKKKELKSPKNKKLDKKPSADVASLSSADFEMTDETSRSDGGAKTKTHDTKRTSKVSPVTPVQI